MLACLQPGFSRGDRVLYGLAAGVPDLWLAPALTFAAQTVISTQTEKLGGIAYALAAQLRAQEREVDVAGFLISDIDANVAARFARAVVIGNRSTAAGRRKAAPGGKANVLHSIAKCGVHHQCLERRARHVV